MKIVFFDGYCNLCNSFVDRVIRWDSRAQLRFASLQGTTAAQELGSVASDESDPSSVIYFREGRKFEQSTAVLRILADLGGAWKLVLAFLIVPRFLRDIVYQIVAKNRYRIFGKRQTCRLPTESERDRLLP